MKNARARACVEPYRRVTPRRTGVPTTTATVPRARAIIKGNRIPGYHAYLSVYLWRIVSGFLIVRSGPWKPQTPDGPDVHPESSPFSSSRRLHLRGGPEVATGWPADELVRPVVRLNVCEPPPPPRWRSPTSQRCRRPAARDSQNCCSCGAAVCTRCFTGNCCCSWPRS